MIFKKFLRLIRGRLERPKYVKFPPPVQDVLRYREVVDERVVPYTGPDTALMALFRIYCAIVSDKHLWMRSEIERFWNRHEWKVSEIPDPCDPDPVRYAVLATIPYLLVWAFNANIELGLPRDAPPFWTREEELEFTTRTKCFDSVPEWAKRVPPLDTQLLLPDSAGRLPSDESKADPDMLRKNIMTRRLPIAFI